MNLTKAEQRIYDLVVLGYPNKKIADVCFISESTVKFHTTVIRKKLGVNSTYKLIANHYIKRVKQLEQTSNELLERLGTAEAQLVSAALTGKPRYPNDALAKFELEKKLEGINMLLSKIPPHIKMGDSCFWKFTSEKVDEVKKQLCEEQNK